MKNSQIQENIILSNLPKGWNYRLLNDLCFIIADIDHKMPKSVDRGIPFLSAKDISNDNKLIFNKCKYISDIDFDRLKRKIKPKRGDIIYSRIGTIGRAAIVDVDVDFLVSYSCCTIRTNHNLIFNKYLLYYLISYTCLHDALGGVVGIGVPDLGMKQIKELNIPLPPLPIQKQIVEKIEELFSELDSGVEELKKVREQLKVYRQSVLSAAFSGKLTKEWRNLEENKDLYKITKEKFIEKRKAEILKIVNHNYHSDDIQIEFKVLKEFILEAICKDVKEELINKVFKDFPFDSYEHRKDNPLRAFLYWQTKSDEFLMLNGYSSYVFSQQRKAWLKYAEEAKAGRSIQEPLMGYSEQELFGIWLEIEKLKREGINCIKEECIIKPAKEEYKKAIDEQNNLPEDFPKGWKIKNFGNVVKEFIRGPFGSTLRKEFFVPVGYKVYEQQNAIYHNIEFGRYFVNEKKFQELIRFEVKEDDYIVSCSGTIGKLFKIPKNTPKGLINQALLIIRIDRTKIIDKYFSYLFMSENFQRLIIKDAKGTAMLNLAGVKDLKLVPFPICSLKEQQKIVEEIETRLSVCDKMEENIETALAQSESLRQSILKQAFEGRLINNIIM